MDFLSAERKGHAVSQKCRRLGCWRFRSSTLFSMKPLPIGSRCGSARSWPRSLSLWVTRAARKTEHQQADGERGQADIVKNDPETGRRERNCEQDHRRPKQIHNGNDERRPAKCGVRE